MEGECIHFYALYYYLELLEVECGAEEVVTVIRWDKLQEVLYSSLWASSEKENTVPGSGILLTIILSTNTRYSLMVHGHVWRIANSTWRLRRFANWWWRVDGWPTRSLAYTPDPDPIIPYRTSRTKTPPKKHKETALFSKILFWKKKNQNIFSSPLFRTSSKWLKLFLLLKSVY